MEVINFIKQNWDNILAIVGFSIPFLMILLKSFMPLLKKLAMITDTKKDDNFLKWVESGMLELVAGLTEANEVMKDLDIAIKELKDEAEKKRLKESFEKLQEGFKKLTKKQ